MMALRILLILQVIVILFSPSSAYPVYGTKSQTYPDDYYYPQESYPVYYPPARTSKYEVYQAVLPYYYGDVRQMARPYGGGYYEADPVVDLHEELLQEEAQPIGHEMLYENDDAQVQDDSLDDVNAAFLQNLIMSQMYKDAVDNQYYDSPYYPQDEIPKWEDAPVQQQPKQDEDVLELKQLKPVTKSKSVDDIHWFQRNNYRNNLKEEEKRDTDSNKVRGTLTAERKPVIQAPSSTLAPKLTLAPKKDARGQKEEVLARPATPVRRPFSPQVLEMMSKSEGERKRSPSVYDTIKHMLDMEKSLENKYGKTSEIRPQMKKRIISSEDSLAQQLTVLKKAK